MTPHQASPHVVFGSTTPPWRDSLYPPHSGGQHFHGTTLDELLAEPPLRSNAWLAAVYARLAVMSSGPVLVAETQNPGTDRTERARWLRVAPDADAARVRAAAWPALPEVSKLGLGVGTPAPDLVIVAERDPYDRLPMFARSGVWLFRALRLLGWDELTIYVTNALDRDQRGQGSKLALLRDAFQAYGPQWLALGAIPAEVLTGAGIEHIAVQHPSHHRRFEFGSGPEGYAAVLEKAGVERKATPVHTVPGTAELANRLGLPLSPSVRPNPSGKRAGPKVAAPLLDKAHQAFVLGQCATLQAAAALVTENAKDRKAIVKLGREQGWEVERERFFADRRERAKTSAADTEGKLIAESRGLAWEVAQLMLTKIRDELLNPNSEVKVYAKDAKAMGELSMALSEKGDAAFDDEKKRLSDLTPEAFAEELKAALKGGFGLEPAPAPTVPPATPTS